MSKHIFVSLVFGVLMFVLGSAFSAVAQWSPPVDSPPTCNTGDPGCDAPLNVGPDQQTKTGELYVSNVLEADNFRSFLDGIFDGKVQIGSSPGSTHALEVDGSVNLTSGNQYLVDGVPVGGGGVSGSGVADRVAYWTSANTIGSDSDFLWSVSQKRLTIDGTMRLIPRGSPPGGPISNGELYYDNTGSHALCVRLSGVWVKIAGGGDCS